MKQVNKEILLLNKILTADFIVGAVTGAIGILCSQLLADLMNIPANQIIFISIVTVLYSICAYALTQQNEISISLVRLLINANWFWAFVSLALLVHYFDRATALGLTYLVLQIVVVTVLAILEGRQLRKVSRTHSAQRL